MPTKQPLKRHILSLQERIDSVKMKILQKIKQSIGSSPKRSCNSIGLAPIRFNQVHGENVHLSPDGQFAKRSQSFCNAIVFSSRPLLINEPITIQLSSLSSAWSGSLRFGCCNADPSQLRHRLPKYMCPDLTNRRGFYAKALNELDTRLSSQLTFWLNERGQLLYKIDGQLRGVLLTVSPNDSNVPMWAMLDVYGMVTSLSIIQPKKLNGLDRSANFARSNPSLPALMPLQLHKTTGTNVRLSDNRTTASRKSLTFGQGYVFTQRPLLINELLLIKILRVDALYSGSLSFGLTTCSPQQLSSCSLPLDSHQLLNRPEYWVLIKDVLANAQPSDELGFCVNELNQLQMVKNGLPPVTLMHVDAGQRFFAFFDLFGRTTAIQVLGTKQLAPASSGSISFPLPSTHGNNSLSNSTTSGSLPYQRSGSLSENNLSNHFAEMNKLEPVKPSKQCSLTVDCKNSTLKKMNNGPPQDSNANECKVCFEQNINSVLYQCGHMCMCYDCAMKQWQGVGGGQCPICRALISDVIRTYWP